MSEMYQRSTDEVLAELGTSVHGLSGKEAAERLARYGQNKLKEAHKITVFQRFLQQIKDPMLLILLAAAAVSAVTNAISGESFAEVFIILVVVLLNAILGVIQESKAEKSIEALQKLSSPQAKVKRNGQSRLIASEELVPGDIVYIEAGNYVPADVRLINAYNFKVEESALTGETIPVEKNAEKIINENSNLGDMENLSFSTTIAVSGHAEGIVTETGMNTKVGKIAQMIITDEAPETPLQKRLRRCRQKAWNNSTCNLCISIFNRTCKTYTSNGNIYGISRTSGCCNSRGITNSCYNNVINWNYKNGKEK